MTTPFPPTLLDCDGVLVDNRDFEIQVTESLVRELSKLNCTSTEDAGRIWANELAATRSHYQWYDYRFHAQRLGIGGTDIVERAHVDALPYLRPQPGALATIEFIYQIGSTPVVVTDATRWVAELKLKFLGVDRSVTIMSSDSTKSVKSQLQYWRAAKRQLSPSVPVALVDNRSENLAAARRVMPTLGAIHFDHDEHVTKLPSAAAPVRGPAGDAFAHCYDHRQLQILLGAMVCESRSLVGRM